ncbi:alpha/beta hydrolase [Lactobacillus sp. CBA3605]|uniref:alpha/beta fold hydrolase n=1 Tax=Lactobacillus sp. CBA3605 TaxID=2099788 RepID=UPI000CFBDF15|nr:alpha/beta hydrolase [Lactobacillus sp. CBA3605]AVK61179.1 alpha/beta hydrolase [Lactobacillus sp. CBA3605]
MTYIDTPNSFVADTRGNQIAYRALGPQEGEPLVLLPHLSANLDNWDPEIIDGLAQKFRVIVFDGSGIGLSGGKTPSTMAEMATACVVFIDALNLAPVNILGLSMGGMVAQAIGLTYPGLIKKLILVSTGPQGGPGITEIAKITNLSILRAGLTFKDIKRYLFFTATPNGQQRATEYLKRLKLRRTNRDKAIGLLSYLNQLKAIRQWGASHREPLETITQPTLIMHGDSDIMVPVENATALTQYIPNSQLTIYPDAGHGALFQFPKESVAEIESFLTLGLK